MCDSQMNLHAKFFLQTCEFYVLLMKCEIVMNTLNISEETFLTFKARIFFL